MNKIILHRIAYVGILFIAAAILFGFIETAYFGFNMLPQSHAEKQCDLICIILFKIGFLSAIFSVVASFILDLSSKKNDA